MKKALVTGITGKAKRNLGWTPKTGFKELVREMVLADLHKEGMA